MRFLLVTALVFCFLAYVSAYKENIDCYTGNGASYQGSKNTAVNGQPCDDWQKATKRKSEHFPGNACKGTGTRGFKEPWCYYDGGKNRGSCGVPMCKGCCENKKPTCTPSHCSGKYASWAVKNCAKTCGTCPSFLESTCAVTAAPAQPQTTLIPTITKTQACLPDSNAWCALSCQNSLCLYGGPSSKCKVIYALGNDLTAADKQTILDEHNALRRNVSEGKQEGLPAATTPIPDLQWDDGLAELAQRWAEQCRGGHDKGRKTSKFSYTVGQNAFTRGQSWEPTSTVMYWGSAVQTWYKEVKDFVSNGHSVKSFKLGKDYMIGHFTQVIWATTTHVGCGFTSYKSGRLYQQKIICNYGPGGNFPGRAIYNAE